jgi:ribA/ribD-fused uncharacterized protein
MKDVISDFRGEYFFLSNYYTAPFGWRGIEFQSAEQAFAYAKTAYTVQMKQESFGRAILAAKTPGEAKKLGREVPMLNVDEWDKNKVYYMREIIHAKFHWVPGLAGRLINTDSAMLVEGNTWGDKYWGRCLDTATGKMVGLNKLGVLLMEERGYWLHSTFEETS